MNKRFIVQFCNILYETSLKKQNEKNILIVFKSKLVTSLFTVHVMLPSVDNERVEVSGTVYD